MANNVVAYVGCDCFDIILYLSSILQKLGKRVLIIDYSESGSLRYSIPSPKGLEVSRDIITYRKVDYTSKEFNIAEAGEYDDILIAFGFKAPPDVSACNHIVYVSDLFTFNQERLAEFCRGVIASENTGKSLLIRNVVYNRMSGIISEGLAEQFDNIVRSYHYYDERDYENSLNCNLNGTVRFSGISKCLRTYLKCEIISLYPNIGKKTLCKAVKKAEKGV